MLPWVLSLLSNPLPSDLQRTGTILAITRTARVAPELAVTLVEALGFTATPSATPTPTVTPTETHTPTPTWTATLVPTVTESPTITLTPLPEVIGSASAKLNTYTCPGLQYKEDTLEEGSIFTVLGWDQTEEEGEVLFWILIENEPGQPQIWVRESPFVILSHENYKDFMPRAACRRVP